MIFSGVEGESARNVIQYLLDTEEPVLEEVQKRIRKSCSIVKFANAQERKEKEEELYKAFAGAKFSPSQKFELKSAYQRIDHTAKQIQDYESMMQEALEPFKSQLELLESIPGISHLSAKQILGEIGPKMDCFVNVKHFISRCGLCPASNQSNGKHKSVKIGKGGRYLKPVLIQCALNAVKNPYFGNKYKAISGRRGKKRALVAIARKMMTAAYHMLRTGECFRPSDESDVSITAVPAENETVEENSCTEAENFVELENVHEIQKTAVERVELTKESDPVLIEKVQILLKQIGIPLQLAETTTKSLLV